MSLLLKWREKNLGKLFTDSKLRFSQLYKKILQTNSIGLWVNGQSSSSMLVIVENKMVKMVTL